MSLTSAWSITRSVHPPRAAFVDFPLGHTSGRADDPVGQHRLMSEALAAFAAIEEPGTIVDLGEDWGDDGWRVNPLGGGGGGGTGRGGGRGGAAGGDTRTERHDTPQYQSEDDARLAADRLGEDVACRACAVFDA